MNHPLSPPLSKGGRLLVSADRYAGFPWKHSPLKKGEEGEATAEPSGGCGERV